METGERCKNHAGFHAELLTFAHELGIKIVLFQAGEIIASEGTNDARASWAVIGASI